MSKERPRFVHLHVHSHYSLLDGASLVDSLLARTAEYEQEAIALTDHGNLYGAVEFHDHARKMGIRPILGMEAYLAAKSMKLKADKERNPTTHLTLLAENEEGWRNLIKLASLANLEGFYRKPRIDKEALASHSKGLIALSGCLSGELNRLLARGEEKKALQVAGEYRDILGKDNFFLEIMRIGMPRQDDLNEGLARIARELSLGLVATNDVHYLGKDDWQVQDVLLAIHTGALLADQDRFRVHTREIYLKSPEEMTLLFRDVPEALENTWTIAQRCDVEIPRGVYHLPVFKTDDGTPPEEFFLRLCEKGLKERYGENPPKEARERLEKETKVVLQMGFASYFLIVWDFIEYARKNGIPVGPGRGSAAGSIVAYVLRITDVDPLRYNLLFERFLNAERISMPDIDVDICREGRQQVIEYVRERYGRESVSQIITFTTMAARRAIRDVGRVLDIPLAEVDKISKKVTEGTLKQSLEKDPELAALRNVDEDHRKLFEYALKIEGLARDPSTHAAGVVIADKPLLEYAPLARPQGEVVTQWQMTQVERIGLLKMDLLGLKNLTILDKAVRLVKENRGVEIDLDHLPLDCPKTFELLRRADTAGIFQLESKGMRDLLVRLQPTKFEDIIALNALHRPGPMESGMVDTYVANKRGDLPVTYPHEDLKEILEDTYGNIVYQEQVMLISVKIAGFSMNEADSLRKAMGKKNDAIMAGFRSKFVEGAVKRGYGKKFAADLFGNMEKFARYGFNKSHATAYAILAYRTAYMKAHYPLEFSCALMSCDAGDTDKLQHFVADAKARGIQVLPPDVNKSGVEFQVEGEAIRYALVALKGVGENAAQAIVQARERLEGGFQDLAHFCEEVDLSVCNRATLESLIKAGAMESITPGRLEALEDLDRCMRVGMEFQKDKKRGQASLFGAAPAGKPRGKTIPRPRRRSNRELSPAQRLAMEKEALGFFLTGHPFEGKKPFYLTLAGNSLKDLLSAEANGSPLEVTASGIITELKERPIKKPGPHMGEKMARAVLDDLTAKVPLVFFPSAWGEVKSRVQEDGIVFIRGNLHLSPQPEIRVETVYTPESMMRMRIKSLFLTLPDEWIQRREKLEEFAEWIGRNRGDKRIFLAFRGERDKVCVMASPGFSVTVTETFLEELEKRLGKGSVEMTLAPLPPLPRRNRWARSG